MSDINRHAVNNYANHMLTDLMIEEGWSYLEIVAVAVTVIDRVHDECPQAVIQFGKKIASCPT